MANREARWKQAGGYWTEGAGEGTEIHRREELLIAGLVKPELCLVLKVFADRIVTTVENWKGTNR